MKLAVVGGGSTYTPELVAGLARERERLDLSELVLQDIDPERREIVGGLAGRMLAAAGYDGELAVTDDLERALDGASFVLIQLRVGGQAARLSDETIPLACGCIGQETTGAGGLGKALRTVPVVLEIAERVRELAADDAWIVDFTNPVGIVVRGLLDADHRAVGLCNVAIGLQRFLAPLLEVEPERVLVDQVGLNHLTWVRAVRVDGDDVLPDLLAERLEELADHVELPACAARAARARSRRTTCVTSTSTTSVLEEQRTGKPRAAEVAEIERELLELYRDPALTTKPALLERRGGAYYSEAATQLVAAARDRKRRRPGRRCPERRDARRAGGRRRGRGAGPDRSRRPGAAAAARRSPPSCSASSSTSRPTSASPRRRPSPASAIWSTRRCSRIRSSARNRRPRS